MYVCCCLFVVDVSLCCACVFVLELYVFLCAGNMCLFVCVCLVLFCCCVVLVFCFGCMFVRLFWQYNLFALLLVCCCVVCMCCFVYFFVLTMFGSLCCRCSVRVLLCCACV